MSQPLKYPQPMRRCILLLALIGALALTLSSATSAPRDEPRLHLDVRVDLSQPNVEQQLIDAGLDVELAIPELGRWQGWLPADQLDKFTALDAVIAVRRPHYAQFASGAALSEGDEALNAAAARTRFDVDGSGIRVAVISDGIAGLAQAQRAGEAPRLVDAKTFGTDTIDQGEEGTVMIEVIHDLAPGAAISFGAVLTDLDHIAAVNYFAQRVDIIVDDVSFALPADQQSDVSRNTTEALDHPDWPLRLYVTAAGNWAESHWSGAWHKGLNGMNLGLPSPGRVHWFGPEQVAVGAENPVAAGNRLVVRPGDVLRLILHWDDPWGRSTNDYNLYLMSSNGEIMGASENTQGVGATNHFPREHIRYEHDGELTELFVVIQNHNDDADPVTFNLFAYPIAGEQPRLYHHTPEGSLLAQSDAEGAITVGAVNVGRETVAAYSSRGPTLNGALKPDIAAVDRVTVSNTTQYAPRFLGTSAAAPHVAGVGALLLEAQPALLAADGGTALLERRLVRDLLLDTARDIPPTGPDLASGAGLVDAIAAITEAQTEIAVVTSSAAQGPGTFREALDSDASIVLFQSSDTSEANGQTISPGNPALSLDNGQIIDGQGWTINASNLPNGLKIGDGSELWGLTITGADQAGVLVEGDHVHLNGITLNNNLVGVRVTGTEAHIAGITVTESRRNGIDIADGGSAFITASTFDSNAGAGVQIARRASHVVIGPATEPPTMQSAADLAIPIGVLNSLPLEPRAGLSHTIVGTVRIDGIPAPNDTTVNIYLDRRLAASVMVDEAASFVATATGPAAELRFAVNGVPLDQRVTFQPGATTSIALHTISPTTVFGFDRAEHAVEGANVFRDNLTAVEIVSDNVPPAGRRLIWGNVIQGNRTNVTSPRSAPTIVDAEWTPSGLGLDGSAAGADVAHLYAGDSTVRRFAASTPVFGGRFRFRDVDVDPDASVFSIITHSAGGQASEESATIELTPSGSVTSVSPSWGYTGGRDDIEICGEAIATDMEGPTVWLGEQVARVTSFDAECVTVTTPAAPAGTVDLTLLPPNGRPITAPAVFQYQAQRSVRLNQGWNLVTWYGTDTRVTTAFASLAGSTFRVYAWDSDEQQWKLFSPDMPPTLITLRTLQRDQSLWVVLESPEVNWRQPVPE